MEKQEIAKTEANSPAEMIRMAVNGKADLAQLKELLSLQREWEAGEAKKAYHKAMSDFKANPPKIDKDKTVAYGNTKYNHASLANVTEKISAELSKHGLSASWTTKQNGSVAVTCRITHVLGHSEETTLSAASDTSGSKNAIQAIGSTITYLERYTLLALTGLATYDMDDDGQAAGAPVNTPPEFISEEQQKILLDNLCVLESSKRPFAVVQSNFLKFMKVSNISEILTSDYGRALTALNAAQNAPAKGKK